MPTKRQENQGTDLEEVKKKTATVAVKRSNFGPVRRENPIFGLN